MGFHDETGLATAVARKRKFLSLNRGLQERVFNIVPYLFKYGPAFMEKLAAAISLDDFDHQVVGL